MGESDQPSPAANPARRAGRVSEGGGHPEPAVTGRHLCLVGPTAAGKSDVALEVAHASRGVPRKWGPFEIVSVDSMVVYRGMDIGTAKPSIADRRLVPHHMIDLVEPWEEYSLSLFQSDVASCIAGIESRGGRALLVGGTGLYLRAVVDGLTPPGRWPEIASQLEAECERQGPEFLHSRLARLDPVGASRMEPTNARRILRALEVTVGSGRPFSSFGPGLTTYPECPFVLVGVDSSRLDDRIASRVGAQMDEGFLGEVAGLRCSLAASGRDWSKTAAQALGYRELIEHLDGETSLPEAVDAIVQRTRRFARRQRRWFRRDPRIRWVDAEGQPGREVATLAGILVK